MCEVWFTILSQSDLRHHCEKSSSRIYFTIQPVGSSVTVYLSASCSWYLLNSHSIQFWRFNMRGLKSSSMMHHHKSTANLTFGHKDDLFNDDLIISANKLSNRRQPAFHGYDLRKASSMMALPDSSWSSKVRVVSINFRYVRQHVLSLFLFS